MDAHFESRSKKQNLQEMEKDVTDCFGIDEGASVFAFDSFGQDERCSLFEIAGSMSRKGKKVLKAKHLNTGGNVEGPLGCVFDEGGEKWLVCNTGADSLCMFTRDLKKMFALQSPSLPKPSSVTVVDPGHTFAVLCDKGVKLGDIRSGELMTVSKSSGYEKCYRGLTLTRCGRYLVSISQKSSPLIEFFDIRCEASEPVSVTSYLEHCGPYGWPRPSFVDCCADLLLVSDLGQGVGAVKGFNVITTRNPFRLTDAPHLAGSSTVSYNFKFPSGLFIDDDQEFLVVDACDLKLLWFDKYASLRGSVQFSDDFVYGSDIHVNRKGELLVCGRRDRCVKLYKLY